MNKRLKIMLSGQLLATLLVLSPQILWAAQGDDQKALAKSQYMLRQATGEKAELEKKNKELEAQLTAAKAELAKSQKLIEFKATEMAQAAERSQQQLTTLEAQKHDTQLEAADLKRNGTLVTTQKNNIELRLTQQNQNLAACIENNHKLAKIGNELLGQYENKGFAAVLKQKEPFTGRKQVEIEKLAQDYQYRLDDAVLISTGE